MTKVNLTFSESKTKTDLTLESKDVGMTWDEATMTWNEATFTWDLPLLVAVLETKTKVDLTKETK
jgi:hypothetical protein